MGKAVRFMDGLSMAQLHADLEKYWARNWAKAVAAYERNPRDFYRAYNFLELHPANQQRLINGQAMSPEGCFGANLDIMVVRVDPRTERIETKKNPNWKKNGKGKRPVDKKRNTATRVWVEWGPWCDAEATPSHDPRVDTGGTTFEEAIVNLAHNVHALYGAAASVPNMAKLEKQDRW